MTQATRKVAVPLLRRLIELDQQTSRAYYEMGQLLAAIQRDKLHELLGFDSFSHLVEEELSFTAGTAGGYARMYRRFRELKYTKTEAHALLYEFGLRDVCTYLEEATKKVGMRTVRKKIKQIREDRIQINFTIGGLQREFIEDALIEFGAERSGERLLHSSVAFINIVEAARKGKGATRRQLQAVA